MLQISKNAFEGCTKLVIYCEKVSYVEKYAQEYGINYAIMDLE